jgi:hypothetical protein
MPAAMMHGGGGCAVHDDDKVRITGNKQQTQNCRRNKQENSVNQKSSEFNMV